MYPTGMSGTTWLRDAAEKTLQRHKGVAKIRDQQFVETGSSVGWSR